VFDLFFFYFFFVKSNTLIDVSLLFDGKQWKKNYNI